MLAEARSLATLLRWLGPWADAEATPATIDRSEVWIRDGFRAWLYQPRRPAHASYLIAPGLHFLGAEDARVNRFCSILAASGFAVLAPFLPDYIAMKITPRVSEDFAAALEWLETRDDLPHRPGLFSISFGSLPALSVAASPACRDRFSHLVCFGGFADLPATLTYCMTGARRDPLNQPAAFLNLLDYIDDVPADREALTGAWHRYLRQTWGRPEMKEPARNTRVAEDIAAGLDDDVREMFLVGTGHRPGGIERCMPALEKMGRAAAFFDPRPYLATIERPVVLVHGKDDDVIPYQQSEALAAAFPPSADVTVVLTGLYDHTRPASDVTSLFREGAGMVAILRAIALGHRKGPSPSLARS